MKLSFLGAAETVTGSRFLLEVEDRKILIDCGLFQGLKKLRQRNWAPFPVKPSSIDAVILTHAHIDHSGYLPVLFKNGFRGKIYCTPATLELCGILLPDSGHLHEEEAKYLNKHNLSKHKPALPLYTLEDAKRCLPSFVTIPNEKLFNPVKGINVHFTPAGHILGSACVHVSDGKRKIIFSGDVGRPVDPVMYPPAKLDETDYLVIESTYGDRLHNRTDPKKILEKTIVDTAKKGGAILIPSFAVGRAQSILHLIAELVREGRVPKFPIFLDSPMAIDTTELFCRYQGEHRLSPKACKTMCELVTYTRSVEESKSIASKHNPKIIISASGMLTGGRILHHLKIYLRDRRNTVILVGYQAAGTRGAALLAGAEEIKIHGEYIPVRAKSVFIDGLSAHADYRELVNWLSESAINPKNTFIVHGEPQSQDAFRRYIKDQLGWDAMIPEHNESVILK
jgi:metallo-beta-lactamase family protein